MLFIVYVFHYCCLHVGYFALCCLVLDLLYNFIYFEHCTYYKYPSMAFLIFSFDPLTLNSDFIGVSLHCNEICLSSSTLLNIVVRLSVISSLASVSHSAFYPNLFPDVLFFMLQITFSPPVVLFLSSFNLWFIYDFLKFCVHLLFYFFFL